jgi:hypothetical protein
VLYFVNNVNFQNDAGAREMIEFQIIIFILHIALASHFESRIDALETELHYGTYPSDMFPDDPRNDNIECETDCDD